MLLVPTEQLVLLAQTVQPDLLDQPEQGPLDQPALLVQTEQLDPPDQLVPTEQRDQLE